MTRLYRQEPVRGRFSNRESLSSYTLRLAEFHSVDAGTLIKEVIQPHINAREKNGDGTNFIGTVDGAGEAASKWAAALNELTGRDDLAQLTMLSAAHICRFDGWVGLRHSRCIECLREATERRGVMYEQLCWALSSYSICVKHNVVMTRACAACGTSDIGGLRRLARVGCCGKCGAWMGGSVFKSVASTDSSRYDLAASEQAISFVDCLKSEKLKLTSGIGLYQKAAEIGFDANYAALGRAIGMAKSSLSTALAKNTLPSAAKVIELSIVAGVGVKRLLLDSSARRQAVAQDELISRAAWNKRVRSRPRDKSELEAALRRALTRKTCISVQGVAEEIGTTGDVLRSRCPDLAKKVRERYTSDRNELSLARHQKACNKIRAVVQQCIVDSLFPSCRRISETLGPINMEARYREFHKAELTRYALYGHGDDPAPVRDRLLSHAKVLIESEWRNNDK